jgi:hypothetical protein
VRTQATFALIALFATGAASADELLAGAHPDGVRAAALYLEMPLGVRDRQNAKPKFGLRLQEYRGAPLGFVGPRQSAAPKTLIDVPLRVRGDDTLRDSGATMLLGKGVIVGIVVGAVVAVSVLNDDDNGGGGGY